MNLSSTGQWQASTTERIAIGKERA